MAKTKALRFWAAWKWVQQVREQRPSYLTSPCTSSRRTAESACCSLRIRGIAYPRGPCNGDIGTCSRIRDSDGSANGARRTTWPRQCARTLTRHASQPDCHVSVRVSSGAMFPLLLLARASRRVKRCLLSTLASYLAQDRGLAGRSGPDRSYATSRSCCWICVFACFSTITDIDSQ